MNRSRIPTVVCVPLTSNLTWKDAPGNVVVERGASRLVKDSVANVSQLIAVDRQPLTEQLSHVPKRLLDDVLDGIDVVLDR